MSTDTVCRVCLVNNMNLYCVGNDLQNVYERLAGEKYSVVGYPVHMCYICLTVLRKCHRFMETARDTNNMLKQWYKQQNEMREVRPLFTYSISKAELVSMFNEDITLQYDIKLEKVDSEQEEGQQEYAECNTDMDKTDIDEQTDYSELLVDTPNDDSLDTDTVECNNDRQTDPLFDDKIYIEESKSLVPSFDGHTNPTKPLHRSQETLDEIVPNSETCINNTLLNSTPSQLDNVRDRSGKTEPMFDKKAKLRKIVKREMIQNKNKQLARITKKNIKNCHKMGLNTSIVATTTVAQHITSNSDKKVFECDICNYISVQKSVFVTHIKTHTGEKPFVCDICDYKCARKANIVVHMRSHTGEKPFSCHICDYKSTHKYSLVQHIRSHTGEKPFSCHICDYKSTHKYNLVQHIRSHTGEKPFVCDICDYKCARKANIVVHMRSHTGEKPFSCHICDYKSTHKNNLVQHMRSHTGEKPFSCGICDFKCSRKPNLVRHMKRHNVEKLFSCDICGFKCAREFYLILHMKNHTIEKPFSCGICNYKSTHKCYLARHMRSHTGEKPFSCDICGFKCARKYNLVRHIRSHPGEKPFSCDMCAFKCSENSSLNRHLLKNHK